MSVIIISKVRCYFISFIVFVYTCGNLNRLKNGTNVDLKLSFLFYSNNFRFEDCWVCGRVPVVVEPVPFIVNLRTHRC